MWGRSARDADRRSRHSSRPCVNNAAALVVLAYIKLIIAIATSVCVLLGGAQDGTRAKSCTWQPARGSCSGTAATIRTGRGSSTSSSRAGDHADAHAERGHQGQADLTCARCPDGVHHVRAAARPALLHDRDGHRRYLLLPHAGRRAHDGRARRRRRRRADRRRARHAQVHAARPVEDARGLRCVLRPCIVGGVVFLKILGLPSILLSQHVLLAVVASGSSRRSARPTLTTFSCRSPYSGVPALRPLSII